MCHTSSSSQPAGFHYPKNSKGPELSARQTNWRLTNPWSTSFCEVHSSSDNQEIPLFQFYWECSSPYSQHPTSCPCLEPDKSSPRPLVLFTIHSNIILTPTPNLPKKPLSSRFPHINTARPSFLPHTCYMSHTSHPSWCNHPNNTWSGP